jgi:type VI secretion system secreted protein Hcp
MPCYLKLPDIPGEVEEQNHAEWIEIENISLPIFRSITEGAKGAQRRSGETSLGDFVIVKQWDSSSAKVAAAVCNGTHMDEVVVHMMSVLNGKNCCNLEVKMSDCILTGYSFMGNKDQKPLPSEQITLNYTEIWWKYTKFDRMGTELGQVPTHYSTEAAASNS